jgi:hypothetical protein
MQTHFEGGLLGAELCQELRTKGIDHFRLGAGEATLYDCQEMLREARECGADHLLILNCIGILKELYDTNVEWGNEPNGQITDASYHKWFMKAYEVCKKNNNLLFGPCINNLSKDALRWMKGFMRFGVPDDVIITYHHYTEKFDKPQEGFASREEEMEALLEIADGRNIACSESGYNSPVEDLQAHHVAQELEFAEKYGLLFWTYFQLNDDVALDLHFGARRADLTWKPVIDCFAR